MPYLNSVAELSSIWRSFGELAAMRKLWGDQGNERNAIIDAEALLCLLLPEAYVERLRTQGGDGSTITASSDVVQILAKLAGPKFGVPRGATLLDESVERILDLFKEYFEYHGGSSPSFSAGSYLTISSGNSGPDEQSIRGKFEVVDVYTYSLTLSFLVLLLLDRWSLGRKRADKVNLIRDYAMKRLTGAMEGLVDSFVVTEPESQSSWEMKTNRSWPGRSSEGLKEVWESLRRQPGTSVGSLEAAFEVGWSWGPVAPIERFGDRTERQGESDRRIYAVKAPYLYFTVGAIDGIRDLFTNEAQAASIFDAHQLALASTLRTYVNLAAKYWAGLARSTSGEGWAIEDMPWITADGDASDYWTLYLLRIVLPDSGTSEHDAPRFIGVLRELAQRGRITRKPVPRDSDSALQLHSPGISLDLEFSVKTAKPECEVIWQIYDFAPQLLKACGQLMEITRDPVHRGALANLTQSVWTHLEARRRPQGNGLWDMLNGAFNEYEEKRTRPYQDARVDSWYMTERMVEALVAVTQGEISRPADPSSLLTFINEIVSDLDYRFAKSEASVDGARHDLKEQRNTIHEVRAKLAQGSATEALEILLPLLYPRKGGGV